MAKLNANYPGQQIDALTAAEWFGPLSGFPVAEVWQAIDRHRRDLTPGRDGLPTGHWVPSLAGILACIDANWREASAARRELEAREARAAARNGKGGATAPPETTEARRILEASKTLPDHPDHVPGPIARQRVDALGDQLAERVDLQKRGELV